MGLLALRALAGGLDPDIRHFAAHRPVRASQRLARRDVGELINKIAYLHHPTAPTTPSALLATAATLAAIAIVGDAGFTAVRHFIQRHFTGNVATGSTAPRITELRPRLIPLRGQGIGCFRPWVPFGVSSSILPLPYASRAKAFSVVVPYRLATVRLQLRPPLCVCLNLRPARGVVNVASAGRIEPQTPCAT